MNEEKSWEFQGRTLAEEERTIQEVVRPPSFSSLALLTPWVALVKGELAIPLVRLTRGMITSKIIILTSVL